MAELRAAATNFLPPADAARPTPQLRALLKAHERTHGLQPGAYLKGVRLSESAHG